MKPHWVQRSAQYATENAGATVTSKLLSNDPKPVNIAVEKIQQSGCNLISHRRHGVSGELTDRNEHLVVNTILVRNQCGEPVGGVYSRCRRTPMRVREFCVLVSSRVRLRRVGCFE